MEQIIQLAIINSGITLGLFVASSQGYVMYRFRLFIIMLLGGRVRIKDDKETISFPTNIHRDIYKPIIGCPVCMVSVWGVIVYALFLNYSISSVYELPAIVLISCCINSILFFNFLEKHL